MEEVPCSSSSVVCERERRRSAAESRIASIELSWVQDRGRQSEQQIASLSEQLDETKNRLRIANRGRDQEQTRANNLMTELERRKTQLTTATEKLSELREQIDNLKKQRDEWTETEKQLQKEMTEMAISSEATALSLQTKLSQKRTRLGTLEEELYKQQEETEARVRNLQIENEKLREQIAKKGGDMATCQHQLILRDAEVKSLRERVGTETPRKTLPRTESMEDMLVTEVKKLKRQLSDLSSKQTTGGSSNALSEELGSLRARNEHLQKQVTDLTDSNTTLRQQLDDQKDETESLRREIDRLNKVLGDRDNETKITHNFLLEENSKVKQQKAELRVRFVECERAFAKLSAEKESQKGGMADLEAVKKDLKETRIELAANEKVKSEQIIEMDDLRQQIVNFEARQVTLESRNKALEQRYASAMRDRNSASEASDECQKHFEKQISELTHEKRLLQQACEELDLQCVQLDKLKRKAEQRLNENNNLHEKMSVDLLTARTDFRKAQETLENEQRETRRLEQKSSYLQEELAATHGDYRSELASLSKQIKETKQTGASDSENLSAQVEHLKSQKRQTDNELNSLRRQIQAAKTEDERRQKDSQALSDELAECKKKLEKFEDIARVAIEKGERYKRESEERGEAVTRLEQNQTELRAKIHSLEKDLDSALLITGRQVDELNQKNEKLHQQEKLVSYLQGQVRAPTPTNKKMTLGTAMLRAPGDRTLQTASSYQDMFADERKKNTELEGELRSLKSRLDGQHQVLRQRQESSSSSSTAVTPLLTKKKFGSTYSVASSTGTMRHDIPHRWKKTLILRPTKCAACLDGLSLARHALKCAECPTTVHRQCSEALLNTCGLPMRYTDYYLEQAQKIDSERGNRAEFNLENTPSAEGRMTGWVRVWRSDQQPKVWRDAWASMDVETLSFYEQENAPDREPFEVVDLTEQKWRIRFQRQADDSHKSADVPYLVEIKIAPHNGSEPYRLYLMAPTLPAKQRWVNALQVATSRRMFARRVSSLSLQRDAFLRLEEPHNLRINWTDVLDEYLLLACEEGLFFTNAKKPNIPYRIAGTGVVYQIEVMQNIDTVVVLTGQDRQIGFIHLADLKQSLRGRNPGVKVTFAADVQLCHLFLSAELQGERYLCICDPDQVHVFRFNTRLGIFVPSEKIPTKEPTSCMVQMASKILIGAETFITYDLGTGLVSDFLDSRDSTLEYATRKASHRQDYPCGAVVINGVQTKEVFLSYQNYGMFVDWEGRRTRKGEFDWVRAPLELAYTAPYLYVLHFESVELFTVPPFNGPDTPVLEPRSMLEVASPHYCGRGLNPTDILLSSTKLNITELLLFNAVRMESKEAKSSLKRKQNQLQRQASDDKRQKSA